MWQIGTAAEVDWIAKDTSIGLTITSGIPPVFEAYATVVLPDPNEQQDLSRHQEQQERHERALLTVLSEHSGNQSWWLGYLETGGADIVFADVPRVTLLPSWDYVLVAAGPEQALTWRERDPCSKGALPDLMFPADRSWLVSTLWDDDWTCVGGANEMVAGLLGHPDLHARARRVTVEEDATPPGHQAI
ncbi:MAG: hypothetical protein M3065_19065 [Actinomycetota bacterium]|nr:hypothetical protein [Actinomycetota bacterium]